MIIKTYLMVIVFLKSVLPFFAGEVPHGGSASGANNNIKQLPSKSKNFYIVSAEGLNDLDFMRLHFSSQGYRDFGKRYAEKVMEVLGDDLKPVSTASSSSETPSSSSEVSSSSNEAESSSSATGIIIIGNASPALNVGKVSYDEGYLKVPVTVARVSVVNVRLYSVLGSEIENVNSLMNAGTNNIHFSRKKLPSGVYMLSVQNASSRATKRIDLSK